MTAKNTTKAEVALATQFTKDNIPELLEKVNKQIDTLTGGESGSTSTAGTEFPGMGIEIRHIDNVADLIKIHGVLVFKEKAYNASITSLNLKKDGIKVPPFEMGGHAASVWVTDIKTRIHEVSYKDKLEKLTKMKELLERNLDENQRFNNDMQSFASLLTD